MRRKTDERVVGQEKTVQITVRIHQILGDDTFNLNRGRRLARRFCEPLTTSIAEKDKAEESQNKKENRIRRKSGWAKAWNPGAKNFEVARQKDFHDIVHKTVNKIDPKAVFGVHVLCQISNPIGI
jgi:hypothetical protein